MESERDKYSMINFEETELRLGLPGGSNDGESSLRNICTTTTATGKRGFSETTAATNVDLKLNLNLCSSSCSSSLNNNNNNDSVSISSVNVDKNKEKNGSASTPTSTPPVTRSNDPAKPPAKAQVVGWPPVRSFRKNIVSGQKSNKEETEKVTVTAATTTTTAVGPSTAATSGSNGGGAYVKVSVEGAPYLRKVDLKQYKSYRELSDALGKMFSATIIDSAVSGPQCQPQHDGKGNGLFTFNGSDYVPTYQDKDGDWMLVGDVPWEMFVESCKRLRIVKGSEAIGLGATPRAAAEEKCKIRS